MRNLLWASALASGLALAACGYDEGEYNQANADYNAEGNYDAAAGGAGYNAATTGWPEGARIVEENGVFYRVDTAGTRIRLEPGDSTILVEDGTRFRVDPDGTRVRIDDEGAVISVGPDESGARVPIEGDTTVANSN